MIYTVTFNPSIDYIMDVDNFTIGKTNRTKGEQLLPGGKGINVSLVLNNLGIPNLALCFLAGSTGISFESLIAKENINAEFIRLPSGMTRINVKLRSGVETEINGAGPDIDEEALKLLYEKLDTLIEGDYLVLAGSVPPSLSKETYGNICKKFSELGINLVVDATGELLTNTLSSRPFLIKPNIHELGEIFNVKITDGDMVTEYAGRLKELGARNVLVSMGGDGAVLVTEDGMSFTLPAPSGQVINTVGAGDSMVAGFLAGYIKKHDFEYALKLGLAAGSASAFSERLADMNEIEAMTKLINEINSGFDSGEQEGWTADSELDEYFRDKRESMLENLPT